MAYFKKLMLKMALLFVLLISIKLATARVPLWISEPHLKAHGRLLLTADDPRDHHYFHHNP
ncbi:hypothetical protein MtrunA17_Chr3g0082831 [Medicago truncatula]|uniref:Transmembrane protein, putative n=1 Tax=Medicago truncatula TaxID=3880 RepID=G7IVW9_MEDTR|nr:transmembrane protein, putative [Medicago truncatula]RHN65703.1 hypothetical protein MtrunA17_Chr3g0082831 [Medicago truncatula]